MAYFTESQLESYAYSSDMIKQASRHLFEAKASGRISLFLSHSHKDRLKAKGLITFLGSQGMDVYVDWNDTDMPRETNRTTAERIRSKIQENLLFLVLATRNAMDSKWVPWEIGIADKTKGETRVLILPVADPSGNFHGNEYCQLYRRVIIADDGKAGVFEPDKTQGEYLTEFLRTYGRV
ncbi:MAG: toll/interleukin-1 receptor domain-containing protein [Verrucomicrobia bacterium]|nr:toll/interleukin-1 receptor domain-containing protein [Verrucomicrobiota bacterium]